MEGEKAAATANEELRFQSSPVDFEVIFSCLKRRQSENESRMFLDKYKEGKKKTKCQRKRRGRGR